MWILSDSPSFIRLSGHNSNPSYNENGTFWVEVEQIQKIKVKTLTDDPDSHVSYIFSLMPLPQFTSITSWVEEFL